MVNLLVEGVLYRLVTIRRTETRGEIMSILLGSVLVLNATYEPIHVCNVKRAITLLYTGVAVCEEFGYGVIRSPSTAMRIPDVIRLKTYVKIPMRHRSFSRKHVFMRDNYSCQYCGATPPLNDLTVDHIHPRSKGGKYTWENVATACKDCNSRKADRDLYETGMVLRKQPKAPSLIHLHLQNVRKIGKSKQSWQKYLFY